jgi:hypothetical protein
LEISPKASPSSVVVNPFFSCRESLLIVENRLLTGCLETQPWVSRRRLRQRERERKKEEQEQERRKKKEREKGKMEG